MVQMKIKILKSKGKDYWYRDYIGKTFEVTWDRISEYKVLHNGNPNIYCVYKEDAKEIKEFNRNNANSRSVCHS